MSFISAESASRCLAAFVLLSGAGLVLTMRGTGAQASNDIGGEAYGAFVQTPTASLARFPLATLDPSTGIADAQAASVSAAGVLAADSVASIATGVIGENAASAQSSSALQNVNILGGLITAKAVTGRASSVSNASTASSNGAGSTFAGLVINGVMLGDGAPAPNTLINIPAVGTVTLNEQTWRGDGRTASGLTVNMIHVRLKDALTGATTGEIIVGAAQSDAAFVR
jgi:hypothetical protein